MAITVPTRLLFIDGDWVEPVRGGRLDVINPTTEEAIGSIPAATADDAAIAVRPATLELGGKSALIVFEDADVERAVEWAMFGAFWTNGQICSATSRLLLHEAIAPRFLALLKSRAESIRTGDPLDRDTRLGPLVSATQLAKVMALIQRGQAAGAALLTGGGRPPHCPRGCFVQPTVLTGVAPDNPVWREEVFGPVLAAATFRSEAEAVAAANDSDFGLAAAVISADLDRCQRVAAAMECGIVWVNCSQPCFVQAPWGGVKDSGYGRELGPFGLEGFSSVKQVTEYTSQDKWDWYPPSSPPAKM